MDGIKYVNLIEIGPVVIEIQGAENGELAVPVNNTLVSHTAFLAADTRPCVLMGKDKPLNKLFLVLAAPTFSLAENSYSLLPSLCYDGPTTSLMIDCSVKSLTMVGWFYHCC